MLEYIGLYTGGHEGFRVPYLKMVDEGSQIAAESMCVWRRCESLDAGEGSNVFEVRKEDRVIQPLRCVVIAGPVDEGEGEKVPRPYEGADCAD